MSEQSSNSNPTWGALAPEFASFIAQQRRAKKLRSNLKPLPAGTTSDPILVDRKSATELLRVAAHRASGLLTKTKHREVVWVRGDSELAIQLTELRLKLQEGVVTVDIPIRCDQLGSANVEAVFVVGAKANPAGLYAAAYRRPNGPALVVDAWGEALTAFAWQCILGMVTGVAGAIGKDARGNVLVPVEMTASRRGLSVVPMARHRISGASGLATKVGASKLR